MMGQHLLDSSVRTLKQEPGPPQRPRSEPTSSLRALFLAGEHSHIVHVQHARYIEMFMAIEKAAPKGGPIST